MHECGSGFYALTLTWNCFNFLLCYRLWWRCSQRLSLATFEWGGVNSWEISEEITILGGQQNTERRFSGRSKELRNEERRFPSMRWQRTQARTRMSHMGDSPSLWKSMGGMARNEGYTKQQLLRLCTTYGVPHTLCDNKHVLTGNLINTVLASDCIPHPRYLNNLSVEACVRPGSVRLRLITR